MHGVPQASVLEPLPFLIQDLFVSENTQHRWDLLSRYIFFLQLLQQWHTALFLNYSTWQLHSSCMDVRLPGSRFGLNYRRICQLNLAKTEFSTLIGQFSNAMQFYHSARLMYNNASRTTELYRAFLKDDQVMHIFYIVQKQLDLTISIWTCYTAPCLRSRNL